MLFDVWLINPALQVINPYVAPVWLGRWFAATPALAITIAASQTGQSASLLQASTFVQSVAFAGRN